MFSDNLMALRKSERLSRSELAQNLYVTPNDIALWEDRHSAPEAHIIEHISEFFGVPVDFLINGSFEEWGPDQFDDWRKLRSDEYDSFISCNGLDAGVARRYFASLDRIAPVTNENCVPDDHHEEKDSKKHFFHCIKSFFKTGWGILVCLGTIITVVSGWPLLRSWILHILSLFGRP